MPIYAFEGVAPQLSEDGDIWVAPDANLIGRVVVETGASVWFGATLRGDNEAIVVGRGSNVQENTICHTDMGFPLTIGENCTIGHKAMLHGCTIEDGALIGMGATILNGAVIGAGSLVGAGALVTENKVIPPGSVVMGMPGKVVKDLDEEGREKLLASAESYRKKMRRFRAGLEAVKP